MNSSLSHVHRCLGLECSGNAIQRPNSFHKFVRRCVFGISEQLNDIALTLNRCQMFFVYVLLH